MYRETDEMTARERFARAFINRKRAFIIAIHVEDDESWVTDIEVARDEGADGIIVIRGRLGTNEDVLNAYRHARERYLRWWIGINLLGYEAHRAVLAIPHDASGLWFDRADIHEGPEGNADYLQRVRNTSDAYHAPYHPLIMPSVAMKYQEKVYDLAAVAKLAEPYADILVTSGDATGVPADFDKVSTLRAAVDVPIGLASGVAVDNVGRYIELGVDVFIVNSSISTDSRLDHWKVHALRMKIPRT